MDAFAKSFAIEFPFCAVAFVFAFPFGAPFAFAFPFGARVAPAFPFAAKIGFEAFMETFMGLG